MKHDSACCYSKAWANVISGPGSCDCMESKSRVNKLKPNQEFMAVHTRMFWDWIWARTFSTAQKLWNSIDTKHKSSKKMMLSKFKMYESGHSQRFLLLLWVCHWPALVACESRRRVKSVWRELWGQAGRIKSSATVSEEQAGARDRT